MTRGVVALVAALTFFPVVSAVEMLRLDGTWTLAKDGAVSAVTVPHDWAIAGPFRPEGDEHTAKLPWRGCGTYERSFALDGRSAALLADGGEAYLEIDGAMASPRVRVNGRDAGGWDYGYMSFSLPVGRFLHAGTNSVSIACDTAKHKSRWYPGGGLYRSVRIRFVPADHVRPGTVFIRTVELGANVATVRADYEMSVTGRQSREFVITNPIPWSVEDPHLYELELGGETFRYGVRTMAFTPDDGFHLNGKRLQLKGVCLHADLGPLGMAFSKDAARRQLAILKDMGANAIRTSHNAPAPEFLDLCDEMGFVVWDECFDKWDGTAGRSDDEDLEEYVSRNLRQLVRRDRNHPCVMLWSIGNEMPPASTNDPHGVTRERCAFFRKVIREEDSTRPVGVGGCLCYISTAEAFAELDVSGWNYQRCYLPVRKENPSQPLVYTESCSCFSAAGEYAFPLPTGRTDWGVSARAESSYDLTAPDYGDIPDVEFNRVERDSFLAGEFVWTGFDYLGEPSPYVRGVSDFHKWGLGDRDIARSSFYGIVGLDGVPKDRYWLYRSHWNPRRPTAHIVPSVWNFPSGSHLPVMVYSSGTEGELFLNGRSLGRRRKVRDLPDYPVDHPKTTNDRARTWRENPYYDILRKYRLIWDDVPYEPGVLEVVCYGADGRVVARDRVETAGVPVRAVVTPDPYSRAGDALRFFRVQAVDAKGVRVPDATGLVRFRLKGPGEIVAVGNADPHGHRSFSDVSAHPLFAGNAIAVVRVQSGVEPVVEAELDGADRISDGEPSFIGAVDPPPGCGIRSDRERRTKCETLIVAKEIANARAVVRAVWKTTALGVYEAYVNGHADGRYVLKPGFTNTKRRRQEFAWDVTGVMRRGKGESNVFAARVTGGWWRDGAAGWSCRRQTNAAFRAVLEVEYADGSRARIPTDASWKAAYAGKVTHAAIFYGETFDNRVDERFLTDPEAFSGWPAATVCHEFRGEVSPLAGPGVCRRTDLTMEGRILRGVGTKADPYVVDFGQNHAGVPVFLFSGARGTTLIANFGEMLNEDGSVYLENMRTCPSQLDYVFSGEGDESYSPQFSYWGYRYASIWADAPISLKSVSSVPVTSVRSEYERGRIETGHAGVNRLVSNCRWGMLSNYLSIPTDCPQRDERQGWTADTQVFAETALYNADVSGFLSKWMTDLSDSLRTDGSVPDYAPSVPRDGECGNHVGWSDALVVVPWSVWRMSGDVAVASRHWKEMCRFVDKMAETGYATPCGQWQYGDWLSHEKWETFRGELWKRENANGQDAARSWWNYLGGCHLVLNARRMAEMARALGRAADERKYEAMAAQARESLRRDFLTKDDDLIDAFQGMQTAHLLALKVSLCHGLKGRDRISRRLAEMLTADGNRLRTGFLGTPLMLDTLTCEARNAKKAYDVLLQRDCPGWLHSVDQGATTVWERWNGYEKSRGFASPAMNSFNHYAYGAVESWLYATAAGIRPGRNGGFSSFLLAPVPDRRLGHVKASFRTDNGEIESSWHYEGNVWRWSFAIPKDTSALVVLPDGRRETLGTGRYERCVVDAVRLPAFDGWFLRGETIGVRGMLPQGVDCTESVESTGGDGVRLTFRLKNAGEGPVALEEGSFGFAFPFDSAFQPGREGLYTATSVAHVWCGDEVAWVWAARPDGSRPYFTAVLTEGRLVSYSLEYDASRVTGGSYYRGSPVLHPPRFELKPGEGKSFSFRLAHSSLRPDRDVLPEGTVVTASTLTPAVGEDVVVDIRSDRGAETRTLRFDAAGERTMRLTACGRETVLRFNVLEDLDEMLVRRARFIAGRQQVRKAGDPLDGAYLIYDRKNAKLVCDGRDDHNAARERLGMGVLMALAARRSGDRALCASLEAHRAFVLRELFDAETATVYNNVGRDNTWHRKYNYPWMSTYWLETWRLTGEKAHLRHAADTLNSYYEKLGGTNQESHVTFCAEIVRALRAAGDEAAAGRLTRNLLRHADSAIRRNGVSPSREVSLTHEGPNLRGVVLAQAFDLTGDRRYREAMERELPRAEAFYALQPDHHLHAQPVRHWDGFWFGGERQYGDTFPQWLGAQNGEFLYWMDKLGLGSGLASWKSNFRGLLSAFFPDGSASCAYYPFLESVCADGQRGHLPFVTPGTYRGHGWDSWANDQDWSLYYAVHYLLELPSCR